MRGRHRDPPRSDGEALAALRARGGRLTRQRSLIWQALLDSVSTHLSAAEICAAVKEKAPELHRATVYRTVDTLVDEGLLLRTDLGADRSYYELPGEHRHHHVVCSSCGAVAHIHQRDVAPIVERVEAASGYAVDDLELTFSGRCPNCDQLGAPAIQGRRISRRGSARAPGSRRRTQPRRSAGPAASRARPPNRRPC